MLCFSRDSISWEKVAARQVLTYPVLGKGHGSTGVALPVLRDGTGDQETSGDFAGLFLPSGGKTGGVGDVDGDYTGKRAQILGADGQSGSQPVATMEGIKPAQVLVNKGVCRALSHSDANGQMERAEGAEPTRPCQRRGRR